MMKHDGHSFTAVGALDLPQWPFARTAVLHSQAVAELHVIIVGKPDGSIGVEVFKNGRHQASYETDMIVAPQGFYMLLTIRRSTSEFLVRVNGTRIPSGLSGTRVKRLFPISTPASPPLEPILVPQEVPRHATEAEALFIGTLGDLKQASESTNWYTLLKSSAVLRLLLLDGLYDRANARHNLKPSFVVPRQDPPPLRNFIIWRYLSRAGGPYALSVGRDQFLRFKLYESQEGHFTVRDVIRAAANAAGGVHFGAPTPHAGEQLVLNLDKTTMVMGHQVSRIYLKEICRATLKACLPLLSAIQGAQ